MTEKIFERIWVAESGKQTKKTQTNHKKQADKMTCWVLDVSANSVQDQGRATLVGAQNMYKMKHFTTWRNQ